ncbi:MAG: dicarboxylate/amino acid:cation symporter [Lentisphaeria bacterium]|nr:dicarboxylate/amino acid:cation symporter [Lentisphaeria bacterium]
METPTKKPGFDTKQFIIWTSALVIGACLGLLGCQWLNGFCDFIASIYTRLFQFIAVPTIALAVTTTLADLGAKKNTGKIFGHTIVYTLLTTLAAAIVGAILYKFIAPANLPAEMIAKGQSDIPKNLEALTVYKHILAVIPNNIVTPFSSGNVLSILIVAAATGLTLALMKQTENVKTLTRMIFGLQELLFTFIKALVWALPLGIVAFAAQLSAQIAAGAAVGSLGKYVAVILGGNVIQFCIILPLFLLCCRLNPLKVFKNMLPAVLMAFFTKSSAATLPVTVASAENNLKAKPEVARFVLPICCTINMNGCAAFILVTSLFLLQNGGTAINLSTMIIWIQIAVISAVGNAGVPMGCYFLTLSLMAGTGAPIGIMGIILPIFTIIDMVETGLNVWSDSCVCAMVDKKIPASESSETC